MLLVIVKGGAVAPEQMTSLRTLEGRQVMVVLRDGTRIDSCHLVSGGRNRAAKLWLFVDGEDVFVARTDVVGVSAAASDQACAA
jgi:hypothetical protein